MCNNIVSAFEEWWLETIIDCTPVDRQSTPRKIHLRGKSTVARQQIKSQSSKNVKSKIAQNRKSIFLSSVQCCDRFAAILNGKRVQIRAEDNEKKFLWRPWEKKYSFWGSWEKMITLLLLMHFTSLTAQNRACNRLKIQTCFSFYTFDEAIKSIQNKMHFWGTAPLCECLDWWGVFLSRESWGAQVTNWGI